MSQTPLIELMGLEELLAAPLRALVEADGMAARAAADFIREHAFEADPDDPYESFGRLRMVTFLYEAEDEAGRAVTREMAVPLLLLTPLPLLSVREARFEFGVEIAGVLSTQTDDTPAAADTPLAVRRHPALLASYARRADAAMRAKTSMEQTVTGDVQVSLLLDQAGLPAGVSELLRLMNDSALRAYPQAAAPTSSTPARIELDAPAEEAVIVLEAETGAAPLVVRILDDAGRPVSDQPVIADLRDRFLSVRPSERVTDAEGVARFELSRRKAVNARAVSRSLILQAPFVNAAGADAAISLPVTVKLAARRSK